MTYSSNVGRDLILVFEKFVTLDVGQLAGHCANLMFWVEEVDHCLKLLDGYRERFERMRKGQDEYQHTQGFAHPYGDGFFPLARVNPLVPPRRGMKDGERKDLRREIIRVFERFLTRLEGECLLEHDAVVQIASRFEISIDSNT